MPDLDHDPELQARIRTGLAELVSHGPDPATRTEQIDLRLATQRDKLTRRRQFLVGAAATTVAVGAGISWNRVRSRDDPTTALVSGGPTSISPQTSESDWVSIGTAPLSDRRDALATWAGDRLIVLGGVTGTGAFPDGLGSSPDGAAWFAAEQRWATISPGPAGTIEGAFSVWNGTELLAGPTEADSNAPWNPNDIDLRDVRYGLAAYNPSTDTWRYVGPLDRWEDHESGNGRQAAWLGDQLLVAHRAARTPGTDFGVDPVYLVDPATGSRRAVDPGPFAASPYPDASGEVMLTAVERWVMAITNWDLQPWVLDLDRFSWRRATSPPDTSSLHLVPAAAIGDQLVVRESGGPRMWLFDPAVDGERAWQEVTPNPFPPARWSYDPVWSGTELFVPGAAYDPATDSWREVPAPPRGRDRQRSLHSHWTGDGLLLFGGEEYTCPDEATCDRARIPDTLDGWLLRDP